MVRIATIIKQKQKFIMLFVLAIASIVFTGCDNGSLGAKSGAIRGYVLDSETNAPISEVLIRATGSTGHTVNKTTYSDGDGSFVIGDVDKGSWKIAVEKYGYSVLTTETEMTFEVNNGETFVMSPIRMTKLASGTKGILKGYPVDGITGRALTNFTVSQTEPYNERKSKTFDSAATFRDTGWTNLEGGTHHYTITANNYETYNTSSADNYPNGIEIGKSPFDLGTISMTPLKVSIGGTLRNIPGYILSDATLGGLTIWAESGGKVVATYTDFSGDDASKVGNVNYYLKVPVTAGSVSVKCKLRGYDVITISSAVSIPSSNPGGIISGVDCDFSTVEPIKADLRVIVLGSKDEPPDTHSSFLNGEIARVYVRSGGKDVVPYADVTSVNFGGEVTISGVITGYDLDIIVINQIRKYCSKTSEKFSIPEGTEIHPISLTLDEN